MDLAYSMRCVARIEKSDIVITNTFFLPLLLSLISPFSNRGSIYVSVHRFPQRQMWLYRRAKRLQCVSTSVADAVKAQSPRVTSLVKVIPNYVASVMSAHAASAAWKARQKTILFVGRVHAEKGIDILIDAFIALPASVREGWKLRIVGPHLEKSGGGGPGYLAFLKSMLDEHNVEVDWVGPIFDREKLNDEYRSASVFVYPSVAARGEAFPLAPLEAMAMGCPCITSDLSCFADYVRPAENAATFHLAPTSASTAQSLSTALSTLIQDVGMRKALSVAGVATAGRFTLSRIADLFIEDFRSLCNSKT